MPGMFRKILRFIFKWTIYLAGVGVGALLIARLITQLTTQAEIYNAESVPAKRVAIVFGAGLRWDGSPTTVLRDRVAKAAELYFAGKADVLLMSGDNRFIDYDEPSAMYRYAVDLGVPEEAIVRDFAGQSTYATCYRARDIFQVGNAILVSQPFHLPRALYICNQLGLDSVGVAANGYQYGRRTLAIWNIRETFATLAALWDVHVARPEPILGNPEPIFPLEVE